MNPTKRAMNPVKKAINQIKRTMKQTNDSKLIASLKASAIMLGSSCLLAMSFSGTATAQVELSQAFKQQILKQSEQQMLQSCKDRTYLTCAGISAKTCRQVSKQIISQCLSPMLNKTATSFSEEASAKAELEMENCADKLIEKFSLNKQKMEQCDPIQQ